MATPIGVRAYYIHTSLLATYGAVTALLFARLWCLSDNGRHPCYYTDKAAMLELGEGLKTIRRSISRLQQIGLISVSIERTEYGRRKSYSIHPSRLDLDGGSIQIGHMSDLDICPKGQDPSIQNGKTHLSILDRPIYPKGIDRSNRRDLKNDLRDDLTTSSLDLKDPRACARDDADDDVSQLASPSWWDEIPDPEDWDAPAEPEETTELKTVEPVVSSEPAAAPAPAPAQRPAPSPAPAPARPKIKRPYSLATGDIPDEMVPGYAKAWFGDLLTENKPAPKADNSAPKPEASIEQKTEPVPAVVDHSIAQTPLASQETARNAPIGGFNVYTPCQETKINPWGSTCVSEFVPPAPPKYTHPQNEDEVYNQMVRYYSEHVLEQPELQTIKDDLHVISENFWDYWDEKHWMRNGSPITSYRRIISNWLTKASRDKQQALSKQPAKSFQQQERDYRAQLDREAEAFQAKLIADAERNKQQLSSPTFELLSNTSNF